MRIVSIVTAFLVTTALYLFVFERDKIIGFAERDVPTAAEDVVETTNDSPEDDKQSRVSVVVLRSEARNIDSAVLLRGRTEAARQVDVKAETSGKMISEPLRKGSQVEAGQLLCQLDPGTREASLSEAKARLPEAEAHIPEAKARMPEALARLDEAKAKLISADINQKAAARLSESGFASESRVAATDATHVSALAAVKSADAGVSTAQAAIESAKAGVLAAKAGIAAAEKEIEHLSMYAPFEGLLESDTAELGSLLQPGSSCATIIQLDQIKLVGFVPEIDVSKVSVGAAAGARLATGQEINGIVTFLSRSADPTTRTFRVEVQLPNLDLSIRDGQTANIAISAPGDFAHLLPLSSLTLDDEGTIGVRVVDDTDTVRFSPVKILRDTVDGIWVAGLSDSADVIVVGQEYVVAGVVVAVTYQEAKG